jgi:hypothetical protein
MKKTKILLYALAIVVAVITVITFSDTYALFETNASGVVNSQIGKWVIKISNQTITDGLNEEIEINNFVYSSSNTVASGAIAPGGSAYFDLVFDATLCDVAVKYDITFRVEDIDYEDNIGISVQNLNAGSTIRTDVNTYSGVIGLSTGSNDDTATIRVNLNWTNDPNYDESDTELGIVEGNHLSVPITVHVIQYLGEQIVEYQEPEPEEPEPEEP